MAHHDHRTVVMPLGQKTGLFPDRQADRRQNPGHALIAQPLFGSADQRVHHCLVLCFHHAPVAGTRTHALLGRLFQREFIDMGADPANDAPVPHGQKKLHPGMFEKRIFARCDQLCHFGFQRRNPMRITGVEFIGNIDKLPGLGLGSNSCYHYILTGHHFILPY